MCSIFKYNECVGRNFDYEKSYKEELRVIEKGEYYNDSRIVGMCTGLVTDEPLMYDGMNGYGLVCGALAFEGNAYYYPPDDDKFSPSAYEFVNYVLRNFHSVKEVKDFISHDDFQIDNVPYSDEFPNSDLHWFIADESESIIVEQTRDGLHWYNGEVMTNNPPYPQQSSTGRFCNLKVGNLTFNPNNYHEYNTRGTETIGLLGDYTSEGRFARLSYLKSKLEESDESFNQVTQSFHLLSSVEQIYGSTPVGEDYEYTIYSIVYDMVNKKVYLKYYDDLEVVHLNG